MATVTAAIGMHMDIKKITRCSTTGANMADAISKADWQRFKAGGHLLNPELAKLSNMFLKWALKPEVDDS